MILHNKRYCQHDELIVLVSRCTPTVDEVAGPEHRAFVKRVLRNFRKRSSELQIDRDGLQKQIESVLEGPELRSKAGCVLENADDALNQLIKKRQHGPGRFSKNVQDFATNFAGFLRVYGGFVDVVRQGGGIYAEVAYGSLSLFFMVSLQS